MYKRDKQWDTVTKLRYRLRSDACNTIFASWNSSSEAERCRGSILKEIEMCHGHIPLMRMTHIYCAPQACGRHLGNEFI